jgi:flagellar hook-length control protein FliK
MELVTALPPELLAGAGPPPGGAAPLLRSSDQDGAATPVALPFELLLGLLQTPLPSGEALPAAGNVLPAVAGAPTGAAVTPESAPSPSGLAPAAAGTDDWLARLRLTVGADAAAPTTSPPVDQDSAAPPPPFTTGDGATPQAPPPTVLPASTPPAAAADPSKGPGAELAAALSAAALSAAVPRAGEGNRPTPRIDLPTADRDPVAESPTAAVLGARDASAAGTANATPAVGEVVSDSARPVQRDAGFESLLPPAASSGDNVAPVPAPAPSANAVAAPAHIASPTHSPASAAPAAPAHGAPVDTRAEHWHEAFAGRVQWLVDQHVGEARIKLNPPELGAVEVKISLVEDKTFVHLTAATSSARDELAQSLPRLRELLSSSGLSLGGATVQGGQTGHGGADGAPRGGPAPTFPPYGEVRDDPAPIRSAAGPRGRIDLFA